MGLIQPARGSCVADRGRWEEGKGEVVWGSRRVAFLSIIMFIVLCFMSYCRKGSWAV